MAGKNMRDLQMFFPGDFRRASLLLMAILCILKSICVYIYI